MQVSSIFDLRCKVQVYTDSHREVRESAEGKAIRMIQKKKEMESGFSVPRRKNGEIISDHMNYNMLNIDGSMSYGRGGNSHNEMSSNAREQYVNEQENGKRRDTSRYFYSSKFSHLVLTFSMMGMSSNYRLVANIWNRKTGEFQNEDFVIDISTGQKKDQVNNDSTEAYIETHEVCFLGSIMRANVEDLYIVLRLFSFETITRVAGELRTHSAYNLDGEALKRPYSCAISSLSISKMHEILYNDQKEADMQLSFQWASGKGRNEKVFAQLHEKMINNADIDNMSVELPFRMTVSLKLEGNTYSLNKNSRRVCSSSIAPLIDIYPDPANDSNKFYITLESGEFSQDSKTSKKNIEIQCFLVDGDGNVRNLLKTCKSTDVPNVWQG